MGLPSCRLRSLRARYPTPQRKSRAMLSCAQADNYLAPPNRNQKQVNYWLRCNSRILRPLVNDYRTYSASMANDSLQDLGYVGRRRRRRRRGKGRGKRRRPPSTFRSPEGEELGTDTSSLSWCAACSTSDTPFSPPPGLTIKRITY